MLARAAIKAHILRNICGVYMYIHELKKWPELTWDKNALNALLIKARFFQGLLLGKMSALGFESREKSSLEILTQDVVHTSEIEGEILNADSVRSSIAKRLGLEIEKTTPADRHIDGIVEVLLDATQNHGAPLSAKRLFGWHASLFPTGWSGMHRITVGQWRTEKSGDMQVVSGKPGRKRVHFEAPSHDRVPFEMKSFITWFNQDEAPDPVIQSALAHFRFVTIHPFDDGNGRIARAIADMMLARSDSGEHRFYSMSTQIQRERSDYYRVLEACQKGSLDVSEWIEWYLNCLIRSIHGSEELLKVVLLKANFWKRHSGGSFNIRQTEMLNRLLDGFAGKLTSSKWAKITKCSQDTAFRDIIDLVNRAILIKESAGGRSTSYRLS
jgi:Fic family protein